MGIVKEVYVNNFKSLKNIKLTFDNFNVVVGRNGSGKTNIIELFKFIKNVLIEEKRPYMPYADWWSYDNIVWKGQTELPIKVKLRMEILRYDVFYEFVFSIIGGFSHIIEEKLTVDDILSIERRGNMLEISHNRDFIDINAAKIKKLLKESYLEKKYRSLEYALKHILDLPKDFSSIFNLFRTSRSSFSGGIKNELSITLITPISKEEKPIVIILPYKKELRLTAKNEEIEEAVELGFPLAFIIFEEIRRVIEHFTILRHPDMKEVKTPTTPKKEEVLSENASNLNNILYYWFLENGGKLPERIEKAMLTLFPNIRVQPSLTSEGKVFLKMSEGNMELSPPCMPDGLYKILAILSAIEIKPSLLAIDEIENSLYAEALEYVIDELRNSGTTVIITTHSPVVVDMIKLEELLISEMTPEGTALRKITDPEKVREKLRELKVTQSESWIYGALPLE